MSLFEDEKFQPVGAGKGKWLVQYGGFSENVKYENENFINEMENIGYLKLSRQDGAIFHMFISKLNHGDVITTTGMLEKKVELKNVIVNSIDSKKDLQYHYEEHWSCLSKDVVPDRSYLEKQLKKLPERVYDLAVKIYMQSMGL